jgi:Luciferase-like monooxygenase
MEIGAAIFFTDYSMEPTALALEERGFDSLWVAEHPHIPVTRRFGLLGGMELTKQYYDVMDPFATLSTAAAVTTRLKLGTGVCLVIQRDTIQTAKLVASLDQVSKGRFLFGIGCGWNAEDWKTTAPFTRRAQMGEEAGRDPQSLSVTLGGAPEDLDVLKRNRDLGIARMTARLPPAKEDEILPILDRCAASPGRNRSRNPRRGDRHSSATAQGRGRIWRR